ncbi:hypothetical protein HUS97_29420, partial [Pseudomonas protegens]|nr:hypothetical protein [Pseudomonas protegens]
IPTSMVSTATVTSTRASKSLRSISLPSLLMLRKDFDARVLVTVAVLTMLVGIVCGLIGAALL